MALCDVCASVLLRAAADPAALVQQPRISSIHQFSDRNTSENSVSL